MTKLRVAFRNYANSRERFSFPLKKTLFSHIEIKKLYVYPQFKHNALNM